MTGEPEKSLIFYWRDPPTEVTEPLSVIPMNALEPNGQNKLLLVGQVNQLTSQGRFINRHTRAVSSGMVREKNIGSLRIRLRFMSVETPS